MTVPPPLRPFAFVLIGVLGAAVCGCAKTGTVEGKATVDGKPATGATVIFSGGNNQSESALVQEDGTYQAPRVPIGEVKAVLMPPLMLGMGKAKGWGKGMPTLQKGEAGPNSLPLPPQQTATTPPAIPKRYTDVKTSGLTLSVTGGRNEFNIEMTSR